MISDLDIYRAANLLIDRHGASALIEAAQMIDRMLANGDEEGRAEISARSFSASAAYR
jgi:hypothetical protein